MGICHKWRFVVHRVFRKASRVWRAHFVCTQLYARQMEERTPCVACLRVRAEVTEFCVECEWIVHAPLQRSSSTARLCRFTRRRTRHPERRGFIWARAARRVSTSAVSRESRARRNRWPEGARRAGRRSRQVGGACSRAQRRCCHKHVVN